ncbi:MAG: hypothetical protein U9R05_10345 [Chloroflexota bacterium]|nr:hypothetical protein [Chloroflexota bacterium]
MYELFVEAEHLKTGLLVRATQDRALLTPEEGKLWATVKAAPIAGHLKVQVPAKDGEPEREARVSVQNCTLTLKPPWRPKRPGTAPLPAITVDAVLVQEVAPPVDITPLEWLLLTNVPVRTFVVFRQDCFDGYNETPLNPPYAGGSRSSGLPLRGEAPPSLVGKRAGGLGNSSV